MKTKVHIYDLYARAGFYYVVASSEDASSSLVVRNRGREKADSIHRGEEIEGRTQLNALW